MHLDIARTVLAARRIEPEQRLHRGVAVGEEIVGIVEHLALTLVAQHHLEMVVEQRDAAREILDHSFEQAHPLLEVADIAAHAAEKRGCAAQPADVGVSVGCQSFHASHSAGTCPLRPGLAAYLLKSLRRENLHLD